MCRGLTELHWIGYSTESIWIQRFKLSTSIPGINLQTCWPKAVSHVTNGIICCICSTSWVTPHFPAAISFFFKQKASRDVEKVKRKLFASPTVKAKSRSLTLVSRQGLSMRQNSQTTSGPTRTEGVSVSFQTYTSKGSILCSQRGHREIQSKMILNILNRAMAQPAVGKPEAGGLVFTGQVVKVKWVLNILEGSLSHQPWETACMWHKKKTNMSWFSKYKDHEQRLHAKSFPKCDQQMRK